MHPRPSGCGFVEAAARRADPFIGGTMSFVIVCLCGIPAIVIARAVMRTWERTHG